jgi:hypothetical protein
VSVQVEFEHWITALRAGVGLVPPVLIAIVLLGGPTAAWLLYRFVVQPRTRRLSRLDAAALWVCPNCRSVNELRLSRCYRCDASRDEADLEVIDAHPTGPIRLAPVGSGLDLGSRPNPKPRPISQIERADEVWVEDETMEALQAQRDRAALPDLAAMTEVAEAPHGRRVGRPPAVPVGPGRPVSRPAVARPRRAVVAGSGPAQDPDDTPAA